MNQRRDEPNARENRPRAADELCADQPLAVRLEALLLSTDRPMTEKRLADVLGIAGPDAAKYIRRAIDDLNEAYEHTGRSFRIESVAGGYQVLTLPAFGALMARLHSDRQQSRLSQAALEALSIVAYRQPIMRAEIEAIRGVACGEILRSLMERRLVKIVGRAEELGRPMLYGTTRQFLKVFGLANLNDLPAVEGLTREPSYRPPKPEKQASEDEQADDADNSPPMDEPKSEMGGDATPAAELDVVTEPAAAGKSALA